MFYKIVFIGIFLFLPLSITFGQNILKGGIYGVNEDGKSAPLPFASVFWRGTNTGTTTDENGQFKLPRTLPGEQYLVAGFVGYHNDTIIVTDNTDSVYILLTANKVLNEVVIEDRLGGNYISQIKPIKTEIITEEGLQQLACCNLSESFENTATVDVGYADAVSGAKRIQMLGLSGNYTQLMLENIPMMRGLSSSYGLTFIPGSWMESIQISKGTSSVINGYESITGQINIEYKKPEKAEKLFVNVYGNDELKFEGNIYSVMKLSSKLSSMLMVHANYSGFKMDRNKDGFMDFPLTKQLNLVSRWRYDNGNVQSIFIFSALKDIRNGGQMDYNRNMDFGTKNKYGLEINTSRYQFTGKTGFGFKGKPYQSFGIQTALTYHDQNSFFGLRKYDGIQTSAYVNMIFETIIVNTFHKISTGLSYMFDNYDENFNDTLLRRTEQVPGIFGQYSYTLPDKLNLILGLRLDYNSKYGVFFTPRIHFRYNITPSLVLRGSAGKGYRTASVIAENMGLLGSSRKFMFEEKFNPEQAWNYGLNLTKEFSLPQKRKASISVDVYRTDFINQVIADMDASPQQVRFYNLRGKSYSNSIQAEFSIEAIPRFDITAAFRYNDVKTTIDGKFVEKPFVNRYKGLLTLSYATKYEKWKFDITSQINGDGRIPSTRENPAQYRRDARSPVYFILHAQITKKFKIIELYAGCENITGYTQKDPIIASGDPFGKYFDSSQIWGPLVGRMFYGGLRIALK